MLDFLKAIFWVGLYVPHEYCYLWETYHLWEAGLTRLHVVADALMVLAYYSIPVALFYFVRQRKDLPFQWIFLLFAAFIICCGTTHLLEIWALWHPAHWLLGSMKAITAMISVFTALKLVPVMPQLLALPNPAELQRLNQELQISQARLVGILDVASDAIISIDANQRITLFNQVAEKIFGYRADEALGQPLDLLLPQQVAALHRQHISNFKERSGNTRRMGERSEIFGRRKDGSEFPAEASISKLEIAGEKTFTAFLRDISDRKQAEAELQAQQQFLRQVIDNNPNLVFVKDWNGKFTLGNQALAEVYNTTIEELIGKTDADFTFNPTDAGDYQQADRYVMQTQQPLLNLEECFTTSEGTVRYFQSTKTPLLSADGQSRYVLGVSSDITTLKQTEAALQQKTEELEGFFSSTIDLLCIANTEGYFLRLNPEWERTLGYRLQDLEGKRFLDFVHPDDVEATVTVTTQLSEQQKIFSFANRYRHQDGSYRWIEWRSVPRGNRIYAAARDITDRKRSEEKLRQSEITKRAMIQAIPDLLIRMRIDGTQLELINKGCVHFLEAENLFAGSVVTNVLPADVAQERLRCAEQALETGNVQFHEYQLTIDGQPYYEEARVVPLQADEVLVMVRDITDRKQMEQALQESETRFRTLIENLQVGVVVYGSQAEILLSNSKAVDLLDLTEAQFLGRTSFDPSWNVIHEDGSLFIGSDHPSAQAIATGCSVRNVIMGIYRPKLKDRVWLLVDAEPRLDGNGKVQQVICTFSDISDRQAALRERKRVEKRLRQSEERLRLALKAAKFGTWECNFVTGELVQSDISEIYGLEPGQTYKTYEEWQTQIHPDDQDWVQAEFDRAVRESGEFDFEFRIVRPDGTMRWTLSTGAVVQNQAGQPLYAYGIVADITDRKLAEVEQKAQQAFLRQVIDTVPNIIFVKNKTGRLLVVNQAGAIAHGTTVEAMLGKRETDFNPNFSPEQLKEFLTVNQQVMQTRRPHTEHSQPIVTAAGEIRWYQTVINPLVDVHGDVIGIVGATTNITNLKQIEQALQQAKEAAEAANKAKSLFLANMSHELRTPLNVILGFAQVMYRDPMLTPDQRENLQIIRRSGDHLLSLINDVLDLSKIEAGHITLDESNVDLMDLLQSLEQMFCQRAEAKGLQLRLFTSNLPQYVTIDVNKLRQILINLLGNAIKFTQQGGVALRVRSIGNTGGYAEDIGSNAEIICLRQSFIYFEVSDTGVGIDPAELEAIFSAFVQTQAGKTLPDGTGLGLTISRKFVQLMGGDITVHSTPGQGSTFAFTLPVHLASSADAAISSAGHQVVRLAPNQPIYRILVVDDQPENRKLLVRLLTQIGFEVREAATGQEAVTQWQQWQPHLIYMDIRMPLLNGYEATQQIRATSDGHTPIIIALTAQASKSDQTLALASGCNDYLSKPFQEEVLLSKMAEHLGLKYLFSTDPTSAADQPLRNSLMSLSSSELFVMPSDWIRALRRSAQLCDDSTIERLIEEIPAERASLIQGLRQLVQNYSFKQIVALTTSGFTDGYAQKDDTSC